MLFLIFTSSLPSTIYTFPLLFTVINFKINLITPLESIQVHLIFLLKERKFLLITIIQCYCTIIQ